MLRTIGTVRLDGERIRCTRRSIERAVGAEMELPLRCDPASVESLEAASAVARDRWHPSVMLRHPREERDGAVVYDVVESPPMTEMELAFVTAVFDGLPRPAAVPDVDRTTAAAIAWRIERTPVAPLRAERMEAATVRPGGAA